MAAMAGRGKGRTGRTGADGAGVGDTTASRAGRAQPRGRRKTVADAPDGQILRPVSRMVATQDAVHMGLPGAVETGGLGDLDAAERETLHVLLGAGIAANSRLALVKDARYLAGWWAAVNGGPMPWPAPPSAVVRFLVHHLYDPEERRRNPDHGMPQAVEERMVASGLKRAPGPAAPATVARRLASWASLHRMRGMKPPTEDPSVRELRRRLFRSSDHMPGRKAPAPVLADTLEALLQTCEIDIDREPLRAARDAALLAVMWASGGRRRSEAGMIRVEHLRRERPQPAEIAPDGALTPEGAASGWLPAMTIALPRTKTTRAIDGARVWLIGRPVELLDAWLAASGIRSGAVFVPIDRHGNPRVTPDGRGFGRRGLDGLSGQAVARIVKARASQAGLDPRGISAHGLRSGFMTEAANRDVPIQQAMAQSLHRSIAVAARYYDESAAARGRGARMMVNPPPAAMPQAATPAAKPERVARRGRKPRP